MKIDKQNLRTPLNHARELEENKKYEDALKIYLDYYESYKNQSEIDLNYLIINLYSSLRGATRCLMNLDKIDEAKILLKEQRAFFEDDFKNPLYAKMRCKIEKIFSDVLYLESTIEKMWRVLDEYYNGKIFEKMNPHLLKSGNIADVITRLIGEIGHYYQKIYTGEAAKKLLDSIVFDVKSKIKSSVSWEPQFFARIAIYYSLLNYFEEAINVNLFAKKLTEKYSEDVPLNWRYGVDHVFNTSIPNWYLKLNKYNECEKWILKNHDKNPQHAAFLHLKMKNYEKAKKYFINHINKYQGLRKDGWSYLCELINFCDIKSGNEINEYYLKQALEGCKKESDVVKAYGLPNIGMNKLRIFRVKDSLFGFDKQRYISFIDEIKETQVFKEKKFFVFPLTYYFSMMGICYLKIGDRENAFKSFKIIFDIEKGMGESCLGGWHNEMEYFDYIGYISEEMGFQEIFIENIRDKNPIKYLMKYYFSEEEFKKYCFKGKKEYFQEGIQGEPGELRSISDNVHTIS